MKVIMFLMALLAASCAGTLARAAASNPFDGEWVDVIVDENEHCDVRVDTSFTVANGHLSQPGSSGTVNPNGSAQGTSANSGLTATWTGHFAGNKAPGRFRRSDGCVGRWSAVRR